MNVGDYMNPNKTDVSASVLLSADMPVFLLSEQDINEHDTYTGVTDTSGRRIGAIKTERLLYLIHKKDAFPFVAVLDHIPLAVVAVDQDSRIFYVNHAYGKILDVEPGKIIGRFLRDIEEDADLLSVLSSKAPSKIENRLVRSVNKYVNAEMYPLYRDDKKFIGAYSIFTDVTKINRLSSELDRVTQIADEYKKETRIGADAIGESESFRYCIEQAGMVAKTDAAVLIRGENGTGKEVISKVIQENSVRANEAFIKINCAAIPEALMESELFGYEEGAFTGAKKGGSIGKFELADHGTIFLDEIGDLPLPMQAKLLRVLQEGEITRVGGNKTVSVDVRLISATNQNLEELIREKKFRADLYYRLKVVEIKVPPLRERGNDILLLANRFLEEHNKRYGSEKTLNTDALGVLIAYDWPGNVRELRNVMESAAILSPEERITKHNLEKILRDLSGIRSEKPGDEGLPEVPAKSGPAGFIVPAAGTLKEQVEQFEAHLLRETLSIYAGDRKKARLHLGLSERTFYRKLAAYQIDYP